MIVQMKQNQFNVLLVLALPILGEKSFDFKPSLDGVTDEIVEELLKIDGGELKAEITATNAGDVLDVTASVNLPILGVKTFDVKPTLEGTEKAVVDELIALDGGKLDATITVSEIS